MHDQLYHIVMKMKMKKEQKQWTYLRLHYNKVAKK